ncbi:MAG: hypothetical protein ACC619_10580 [Paracoccaceae bacterium]
MKDFVASIDRRRFWGNVAGYLIVLVLFSRGPPMTGFFGQAVWAYVWFYPIYYIGTLIYRYQRQRGGQ